MVAEIVKRFKGKSAIDGEKVNLCIARYYAELAITTHPWNGVLVTTEQARALARNQGKRNLAFPKGLQEEQARLKSV